MEDVVLVTGALGLVATATVAQLSAQRRRVVATDLDTSTNLAAADTLPNGIEVRWADLTNPTQAAALLAEITERTGWKRYPLRLMAPLAREFLKRRSPYYRQPGRYANPWEAVRTRWGAPEADRRTP